MLGVLITLLFAVGAACLGQVLLRRLTLNLDPAARLGLAGLVGLGTVGTLTLFVGLVPGGLSAVGLAVLLLLLLGATIFVIRQGDLRSSVKRPEGLVSLFSLGITLTFVFVLVSVLAPCDVVEWDSLAYHLAVPKIWLQAGHIVPISFIHHSNFPFSVDNLYVWGLLWGGECGAKAFTLAFQIFGTLAVFGLGRQIYGAMAGWWGALSWCTTPVVFWLSGTAYIDVQNGLFAGLGILFAALWIRDRTMSNAWLSGILLGFAASSKYTGLQTIFAVGLVVILAFALHRRSKEPGERGLVSGLAVMCGVALLIASPWYVKNVVWTGNPVYPFFYSRLGGRYWSAWQSTIYTAEQQSFGVGSEQPGGKVDPLRFGHAVLGLGYQPGRYINPGQGSGEGFPIGAIGIVSLTSMLVWLASRRSSALEGAAIGITLVSFAMWFFLSEQSRYIITLCVPLSVLAGGAVSRLRAGPILGVAIVAQAAISLYVIKALRFDQQIQVVVGRISSQDYRKASIPFFDPAQHLNQVGKTGRVALYDEVFGELLDVPYLWANPGHSNELGYESMGSGADLVAALKREGVTLVYLNLAIYPRDDPALLRWLSAAGLTQPAVPYAKTEIAEHSGDLNWKSKALLADAIRNQEIVLERPFGSRLVFSVP